MKYKKELNSSVESVIDDIEIELCKAEAKLIEAENDELKDVKATLTDALVIIQDLIYDLR